MVKHLLSQLDATSAYKITDIRISTGLNYQTAANYQTVGNSWPRLSQKSTKKNTHMVDPDKYNHRVTPVQQEISPGPYLNLIQIRQDYNYTKEATYPGCSPPVTQSQVGLVTDSPMNLMNKQYRFCMVGPPTRVDESHSSVLMNHEK